MDLEKILKIILDWMNYRELGKIKYMRVYLII
jgi:hypothetical protein